MVEPDLAQNARAATRPAGTAAVLRDRITQDMNRKAHFERLARPVPGITSIHAPCVDSVAVCVRALASPMCLDHQQLALATFVAHPCAECHHAGAPPSAHADSFC